MDNQREDIIRTRAKELWEREGKPEGRDEEIWYRAAEEFDKGQPAPESQQQGDQSQSW